MPTGSATATGRTQVTVTARLVPPAADHLQDAPDLSNGGHVFSGSSFWSNADADTTDTQEPTIYRPWVWHKMYATAGLCVFYDDPSGSYADTYAELFTGPANATLFSQLTLVGTGDDEQGNGRPRIEFNNPGAQWLYIAHTGYNGGRHSGQRMVWSVPVLTHPIIVSRTVVSVTARLAKHPVFTLQGSVSVALPQVQGIECQVLSSGTVDNPKQYTPDAQPTIHFV